MTRSSVNTRTKLHFSRFEFKYVLPQALREEVESELLHFVELDPFVVDKPGNQYIVRSLYFDDHLFSSFHEKMDGLHTRSKFRVRTYTNEPGDGTPWFLEIKGRYNNLVFKHRTPVSCEGIDPRVHGDALTAEIMRRADTSTVSTQFEFEFFRKRIRPVVLVDYMRRPYISKFDPEFRLTFDSALRATATGAMLPSTTDRTRRLVRGSTVMEVKFRRHMPSWFHRILQACQLRRRSISKICEGVIGLELAEDL